ncbi:MAG: cell division protein FtsW [Armatimonadetes bacterium]|nr:cell division protein FtsW [Armatimonadota bacterium]
MKRPGPDYWLFAVVVALTTIGVVAVYSASYPRAAARSAEQLKLDQIDPGATSAVQLLADATARKQMSFMLKHAGFAGIGLLCLGLAMVMPLEVLRARRLVRLAMGVTLGLLALTYTALGVSNQTFAHRWVNLFGFTIQPSELAKVTVALYLASTMDRSPRRLNDLHWLWRPALTVLAAVALTLRQPHLGGAIMLAGITCAVLWAAGLSRRNWALLAILAVAAVTASVVKEPYQLARLTSFLDPLHAEQREGMHIIRCGTALSRGGWSGRGMGRSIEKFDWLPECHSDSILAVLGEEFGFLGTLTVLALFVTLGWRGLRIAQARQDRFGRLLAVGLTASLFGQGMLNIGVTSGLLPQTGVGLPFITYGGTSLVISLLTVGLLLNLSRESGADARSGETEAYLVGSKGLR